jgi:ELWxxDGT repeat protein
MRRIDFRELVTAALARLRRGTLRRPRVRHGIPERLEPRVLLDASLVKDINPVLTTAGSDPAHSVEINGVLYFQANGEGYGAELWKSDGTSTGTVLVRDIFPGSTGSGPAVLTNVNGTLYFRADDGIAGLELWKSDGTSSGTVLVRDIRSGGGS